MVGVEQFSQPLPDLDAPHVLSLRPADDPISDSLMKRSAWAFMFAAW
jgi:hypothetical protein